MAGAGIREVVTLGERECRCAIGIGVSAAVVLRGWDCETALMRLPFLEEVSYETLVGLDALTFGGSLVQHARFGELTGDV